jgi:hypothetical protein
LTESLKSTPGGEWLDGLEIGRSGRPTPKTLRVSWLGAYVTTPYTSPFTVRHASLE